MGPRKLPQLFSWSNKSQVPQRVRQYSLCLRFLACTNTYVHQFISSAGVLSSRPARGAKKATPFVQPEQQEPNTTGKIFTHLATYMQKQLAAFFKNTYMQVQRVLACHQEGRCLMVSKETQQDDTFRGQYTCTRICCSHIHIHCTRTQYTLHVTQIVSSAGVLSGQPVRGQDG